MSKSILFILSFMTSFVIYANLSPQKCPYSKKILLELSQSGMGNRLLSIISTSLLSTKMNRELEIIWTPNAACPSNYTDLFIPPPSLNYHNKNQNITLRVRCHLELTQKNNFRDFWFIKDETLFNTVDNHCDIIHIKSNQFFAPMILHSQIHQHNPVILHSFYHSLATCLFTPTHVAYKGMEDIIKKFGGQKFLSIHARLY